MYGTALVLERAIWDGLDLHFPAMSPPISASVLATLERRGTFCSHKGDCCVRHSVAQALEAQDFIQALLELRPSVTNSGNQRSKTVSSHCRDRPLPVTKTH